MHTSKIIQTEQLIVVYLRIYTYKTTIKEKGNHEFERQYVGGVRKVVTQEVAKSQEEGNDIIIISKK